MKTKKETIDRVLEIFNQAPKEFIFTNNDKILTPEDIQLRKLFTYKGVPTVSNDEMVFRKFNKLRNYSGIDRIMKNVRSCFISSRARFNQREYCKNIADKGFSFIERIRSNVFLLNNKTIIEDIKLIFSTLWSKISKDNEEYIQRKMNDFYL